jgi:choline dehydrogenase-like flavoprotein
VGSNLTVLSYSHATRLLVEEDNRAVVGVELVRFGRTEQYFATREVILSAGKGTKVVNNIQSES